MTGDVLERIYQESLEERIISYLEETEKISLEKAMSIYYNSKLAGKSTKGSMVSNTWIIKFWFRFCAKQRQTLYKKRKSFRANDTLPCYQYESSLL